MLGFSGRFVHQPWGHDPAYGSFIMACGVAGGRARREPYSYQCAARRERVKVPVYISVASVWLVSVSLSYVLGVYWGWGMVGVYAAFIADEWVKTILLRLRWKSRRWESMSLIEREKPPGYVPF